MINCWAGHAGNLIKLIIISSTISSSCRRVAIIVIFTSSSFAIITWTSTLTSYDIIFACVKVLCLQQRYYITSMTEKYMIYHVQHGLAGTPYTQPMISDVSIVTSTTNTEWNRKLLNKIPESESCPSVPTRWIQKGYVQSQSWTRGLKQSTRVLYYSVYCVWWFYSWLHVRVKLGTFLALT